MALAFGELLLGVWFHFSFRRKLAIDGVFIGALRI